MVKKADTEKEIKKEKKEVKKTPEAEQIKADEILNVNTTDVKEELTNYMKLVIDKEVNKAVEKSTKKLIRHKNIIIIRRDIFIVILLIICLLLGYGLLSKSDINVDISNKHSKSSKTVEKEEQAQEPTINEEEDKKENLKEKYKYLTDDIFINEESPYLKDFYDGNLSSELKLYLAMNNINSDKIVNEDGTLYVDEADLKDVYEKLFTGDYEGKSFKYGNLNFKYLSKGLFWADGKYEKVLSNIVKNIIDVKEEENELEITTVEGLVKDNKLYNIVSNKEVKNYKDGELDKYEDSLTKMVYNFEKSDDIYRLTKLSSI